MHMCCRDCDELYGRSRPQGCQKGTLDSVGVARCYPCTLEFASMHVVPLASGHDREDFSELYFSCLHDISFICLPICLTGSLHALPSCS